MQPKVISLCSGAGVGEFGICDHFQTVLAVDLDWRAVCSHMANHRGVRAVHGDADSASLIGWALKHVESVGGIIATPPCPPFSVAGEADPNDPRAAVFLSALKWVAAYHPAFVIIENVPGLQRSPFLPVLLRRLEFLGFQVQTWTLDAASFGTPQHRERLFTVATKRGVPVPEQPQPTHGPGLLPYRTLSDAIGNLPEAEALALGCAALSPKRAKLLAHVPPGGNWQDLPPDLQAKVIRACKGRKPHPRIARRYGWDDTPGALLTFPHVRNWSMPLPPHVTRPFSVAEYLRIQGVDRPMHLLGSVKQRYAQAGNGVPPALMAAVCQAVAKVLPLKIFENSCGDFFSA